ncbi:prepilin-type N-terminal cleavage/methylation domain-containing protein [Clostridium malenominatum]|uniref:Prepilin-type N-terminal cleavage/methylation domain-containing protein n=1 Tax=Clostridium malenominatum TaxID=1539 RepID=A0ABN1INE5_9CLOT
MKRTKKGFTLVELLVVIAIIAILAAIIAPNAFKAIEKSKVATAESDYRAVKTATLNYYADTGKWPASMDNLTSDPPVAGWNGSYLEKLPSKNPWGGTYALGASGKFLKLTNVPKSAAEKIDLDLDGTVSNVGGSVTYTTSYPTTVTIIISE